MKKIKGIALLAICASLLFGCGQSNNSENEKAASEKRTASLMSLSELTTLDAAGMLDFPDAIALSAVYEGLYSLNEKDEVIPAAAEELPEISEDGLTYTIKLQEDMKWSNGDPVTAEDFEYSWKRLANPDNGYIYSFLIQETIKNGVAVASGEKPVDDLGVEAVDERTLKVELFEPKPFFTSLLTFPTFLPQNKNAVEEFGDKYGTSGDTVVYNGAFTIKNWAQTDTTWELHKNDSYWDAENVAMDVIYYQAVKEPSTAINLFEDGSLDLAFLSGTLAQMNQDHEAFKAYPTSTMNYIRLNQKRGDKETPLANENLRKALALGIDKETLINNVVADGSIPLYGMITEGFVKNPSTDADFREDAGDLMKFNETEAQKYWKEAQKELGENITLDLMTTDADNYKKLGESLQGEWQNRFEGLTIEVRSLPTESALNLSRESDYDMFLIYWAPDYQDPISTLNMLYSGNDRNYSNAKYDELLDKASQEYALDLDKRWETLIEAEKVAIEETAGMIVLSQNQQTVLQNPELEGVTFHTFAAQLSLKDLK